MRSYLDFIHGPDVGPAARRLFDDYLRALLEATGRDRIHFASNFHHRSWRRQLQFIVNYGHERAPLGVIAGYVTAASEGPVHSFHNVRAFAERNEKAALAYWSNVENVANIKAGIARADYAWQPASKDEPTHDVKVAALALATLRGGPGSPVPERYPEWLRTRAKPLAATRSEVAAVVAQLAEEAPAPFWIPIEVFRRSSPNKVALLAQYLQAQGLRPRQVAETLRLQDLQDETGRPVSKLLYDWRERYPATFERHPSRYELPEPPSHLEHVRFCRVD